MRSTSPPRHFGRIATGWHFRRLRFAGWGVFVIIMLAASGFAEGPVARVAAPDSSATIVALTVEPAEIVLHAANRQQQLLVTGRRADGKIVDLTPQAEFTIGDRTVAQITSAAIIGIHDGATD